MTDILADVAPTPVGRRTDVSWPRPVASATLPLIGRDVESARLAALLTGGHGGALVVRGAPGVGKTALLRHAVESASGHRVLSVRGIPAEARLPFAGLQLLCARLDRERDRMAAHHRDALATALGLRVGPAPDPFLVGMAVVALLTLTAQPQPVLCVVDDAHWWDAESAHVLTFAARRLARAAVTLLIALPGAGFTGLPELVLSGLRRADARLLLTEALPAPIDDAVADRIVAEARGNPRAVLAAARTAAPAELAGGYAVGPAAQPGSATGDPLDRLPADSRSLLLLAAAEPLGDPLRLWRAAAELDIPAAAAEPLEADGLLSFGPRVVFRDPWLRSSVYWLACPTARRRVHGALAAATDRCAEPDRRAWHLAHSLVAPDDAVGDELAAHTGAARERGGLAAAAAFGEQAALRTATSATRIERAITAADACHAAGATERATRLLDMAELGPLDDRLRARLDRTRARIAFDTTRGRLAILDLLRSARDLEVHDPPLAGETYLEAMGGAIFAGHPDIVDAVLARLAQHEQGGTDRLVEGVTQRSAGGYAAAVEPLKLALKTLDHDHGDDTRTRLIACMVASDLWDDGAWDELTRTELRRVRQLGARTMLPYVLTHRALVEVLSGQFAAAEAQVNESLAMSDSANTPPFSQGAVVLAAWRGQEHPALRMSDDVANGRTGMAVTMSCYARAVLANGTGAYHDAVTATRHMVDRDGLDFGGWSLVELVEGAVRCGEIAVARAALERLTEQTCLSSTQWALGAEARSRALLEHGDRAELWYVQAIERLSRSRIMTHLARARLLYGEWLRRQGRRVDARVQLRAAADAFTGMGAAAFAARADRELLASGERARRRVDETRFELTPQETRIAALARDGRSNPEIATMLTISPRTVEYHLHKVFTKLGISSRTELHLVLRDLGQLGQQHR